MSPDRYNVEATCGHPGCQQETGVVLYQGRIMGFRCERHAHERLERLREVAAPMHVAVNWWLIQGWLSLATAAASYGLWGVSLRWLPLLAVSLVPSAITILKRRK